MESQRPNRLIMIAFIIATILGGQNAIAVRFSNAELPPFFGAAARFAIASMLLFVIVLVMRLPLPTGRSLIGVLIYGGLQFGFSYALLYWSLLQLKAGTVQVLIALVPLMTFILAILHRQETFEWRILVGGLVALVGIAFVFGNQLSANVPLLPLLAVVLAAAFFAEAVVFVKSFPRAHPITTNAVGMMAGAVILFVMSLLWQEVPKLPTLPATWLAVAYLIVFGSVVVFALSLYVLSHWKATASSYQLVLMPIVTVLSAALIANEAVTPSLLIGGLLVLLGVYIGAVAPPDLIIRLFSRKPAAAQ
jgi:drug/metabolite transporter (DMT)-like permease